MNIGNGLKAIINVGCGLWMIIGTIVILGGFNQSSSGQIYVGIIFGLVAPIIIRFVIFYIINSFK
jgi:hypothetical protein|tara:strand:+ start:272 stop:466 length:195 start_codon:yes stop_codon:yes gene_type:complete